MNVNVTLSAEAVLVEKARRVARQQGTTLNDLFRRYLESLVGKRNQGEVIERLLERIAEHPGDSRGKKYSREATYAERLGRYRGGTR